MKRQKKTDVKVIRVLPEKLAAVTGGKSVLGGVEVNCGGVDDGP